MCGRLTNNTKNMLINEKKFVKELKINKEQLEKLKNEGLFFIKLSNQFFYKVEDFNSLKKQK